MDRDKQVETEQKVSESTLQEQEDRVHKDSSLIVTTAEHYLQQINEQTANTKDRKRTNRPEAEKQKQTVFETAAEDKGQTEKQVLEQERSIQSEVFTRIYERFNRKSISRISTFILQICLRYTIDNRLLKCFINSKLRLPDLNGVRIDYISDSYLDLQYFLKDCIPFKLNLFTINWDASSKTGIKSKYYISSFSKAATAASKEVYFFCIDFSAEDLQTILKAAHNAERIVLCYCCIHCSSGMDFGKDLRYEIKYLGFQSCGSARFGVRTTDWIADPACFSLIVDAIRSSGLRNSLKKVSIHNNPTLSKSKVQKQFTEKNMSHISVIEEDLWPQSCK